MVFHLANCHEIQQESLFSVLLGILHLVSVAHTVVQYVHDVQTVMIIHAMIVTTVVIPSLP